ncbi:S-layer homology domain-containing protein [Brevibacillus sp. TJ4]|uniref:S-layer homology domain-containing protein n=1 Tax=Brevibacillus sp. TJ4 TaxID=3234853 RepID=UPI0037D82CCF
MNKRSKPWRLTAGVTTAILLGPTLAGVGAPGVLPAAYAAEQAAGELSREDAIKRAQEQLEFLAGYKLERANHYVDPTESVYWTMTWKNDSNERISIDLDASTGVLQRFFRYVERPSSAVAGGKLDAEAAKQTAVRFLEKVASPEERAKLSEANEYPSFSGYYGSVRENQFTFTRVENGLPFLENGFEIVLDETGEVQSYWRNWYEGELPDPAEVISEEEAAELLAQEIAPSLMHQSLSSMYPTIASNSQTAMIYRFGPHDPQYVNAVDGTVINALGKPSQARTIEPLGSTVSTVQQQRITVEEAQKIADQVIKRLPGNYQSEGQRGSGSSSGSDGIEYSYWVFAYEPLHGSGEDAVPVEISIGDRGELVEYQLDSNRRFGSTGPITGETVTWEQAQQSAVELVKTLLADRLGEIYLMPDPGEGQVKWALEQGSSYRVSFGWLHAGVPIENAEFSVDVDPKTGEVVELRVNLRDLRRTLAEPKQAVDLDTVRATLRDEHKLMLTYYQPGIYFQPSEAANGPLLVYRYVGESGFVDATTGEWISYSQLEERAKPQDIADHPQQEALEWAVRYGLLQVTDGKLEPERQVTRGEMAQVISRLSDMAEFHRAVYFGYDDTEQVTFADIGETHPLYGVIQKNLRQGYIEKTAQRFEPEQPVTRAQAADMIARLLGYKDLLDNPEIFNSPFTDLQSHQVAAVSILHGEGVFPGKSANRFDPNGSLTRAELAQIAQALVQYKEKR